MLGPRERHARRGPLLECSWLPDDGTVRWCRATTGRPAECLTGRRGRVATYGFLVASGRRTQKRGQATRSRQATEAVDTGWDHRPGDTRNDPRSQCLSSRPATPQTVEWCVPLSANRHHQRSQ